MLNVQRTKKYYIRKESGLVRVPSKFGNVLLLLMKHFVFNARLTLIHVKDNNNIIYFSICFRWMDVARSLFSALSGTRVDRYGRYIINQFSP
jgi:hypothetical protein